MADPKLGRYALRGVLEAQDKFITRQTEIIDLPLGMGRGTRVVYRLPNGIIHRNYDQPAVKYSCGLQKWYQYGKLHRILYPAVVHDTYIEKWYYKGNLSGNFDSPVVISTFGPAEYDNEHYN
jgi:hypothetical protein